MRQIQDAEALDAAFQAPVFLLVKHSTICPVSHAAFAQVEAFVADHADIETGWIDVRADRALSLAVQARTGVHHESPQALWLEAGEAVWDASHYAIQKKALEEATPSTRRDSGSRGS